MGYPTMRYQNYKAVQRAPGFVSGQWRQGQQGEFGPRGLGMTVINSSGADIAADKIVTITTMDTTTRLPKIVLAANNVQGQQDLWVTPAVIHNGKTGIIMKGGLSGKTLNTNGITAGNQIWLDATGAGTFTGTMPTSASQRVQQVGYVVTASSTVGQVLWDIEENSIQYSTNELNPQISQMAKVNIPIATFCTLTNAVPLQVLAAPGSNNFYNVEQVAIAYNYDGTHALTGGTSNTVTLAYTGGTVVHASSVPVNQFTASNSTLNILPPITSTLAITSLSNTALNLLGGSGTAYTQNSSTGSVDVFVWYTIIQL